jgi:hypothetical protein
VAKRNPRTGSRFDDFLKEEGIFEEVQAKALKRALAEPTNQGVVGSNPAGRARIQLVTSCK